MTTVNRGTIEYLEIFLSHASDYGKMRIRTLKAKFRAFFEAAEQVERKAAESCFVF